MIDDLPLTYLHVFTYSARPGTPAAELSNQVQGNIARDRNQVLRDLGERKKLSFMRAFVGRKIDAITLNVTKASYTDALTDNYLKLRIPGIHKRNQWLETIIERVEDGVLVGIAPPQGGYVLLDRDLPNLA
jgi:tRNA A37 methylthiotransferase MiaB